MECQFVRPSVFTRIVFDQEFWFDFLCDNFPKFELHVHSHKLGMQLPMDNRLDDFWAHFSHGWPWPHFQGHSPVTLKMTQYMSWHRVHHSLDVSHNFCSGIVAYMYIKMCTLASSYSKQAKMGERIRNTQGCNRSSCTRLYINACWFTTIIKQTQMAQTSFINITTTVLARTFLISGTNSKVETDAAHNHIVQVLYLAASNAFELWMNKKVYCISLTCIYYPLFLGFFVVNYF